MARSLARSWASLKLLMLAPVAFAAIGAQSPAGAAEKFRVILDWFVNPDHAPLIVALEKGYFAERGRRAKRGSVAAQARRFNSSSKSGR